MGVVMELRHDDGTPPYVVRWLDDGHEALVFPARTRGWNHPPRPAMPVTELDRPPAGLTAVLQLAAVLVGPLRALLGTQPVSLADLAWCAVAATIPALVLTGLRRVRAIHHIPSDAIVE
jgi:hypothetical protein